MSASPWRRLAAWLLDWLAILGWVAVTAAIGIPLLLAGMLRPVGPAVLNGISVVVLVLPIVVVLTVLEARGRQGSLGKRALGLVVRGHYSGGPLGTRRALVRNAVKVGVPWTLGHVAVIAIVATGDEPVTPVWLWALTACAYVLPVVFAGSLFIGSGRTPYDRLAGSIVTRERLLRGSVDPAAAAPGPRHAEGVSRPGPTR